MIHPTLTDKFLTRLVIFAKKDLTEYYYNMNEVLRDVNVLTRAKLYDTIFSKEKQKEYMIKNLNKNFRRM